MFGCVGYNDGLLLCVFLKFLQISLRYYYFDTEACIKTSKESEETKMAFSFSKKKFFKKFILGIGALLKYIIGGIAESLIFS